MKKRLSTTPPLAHTGRRGIIGLIGAALLALAPTGITPGAAGIAATATVAATTLPQVGCGECPTDRWNGRLECLNTLSRCAPPNRAENCEAGCYADDNRSYCQPVQGVACTTAESPAHKNVTCQNGLWHSITGGPCYVDSDCLDIDVCTTLQNAGTPSKMSGIKGACTRNTHPNEECTQDRDCPASKPKCEGTAGARVCRAPQNSICASDKDCANGLICDIGEVNACKQAVGGACMSTADCAKPSTCFGMICKSSKGGKCANSTQCLDGFVCSVNNSCVEKPPEPCKSACKKGEEVTTPKNCLSLHAVPLPSAAIGTDFAPPSPLACIDAPTPAVKSARLDAPGGIRCSKADGSMVSCIEAMASLFYACPVGSDYIWTTVEGTNCATYADRACEGHRSNNETHSVCGAAAGAGEKHYGF